MRSHELAIAAWEAGRFDARIVSVPTPPVVRGAEPGRFARDEGPRADSTIRELARAAGAFRTGGTVTASNSCSLNDDRQRLNVNGGAIAIGHPLGCSGVRLVGAQASELQRRHARYGVAALCVGEGVATILETVSEGGR